MIEVLTIWTYKCIQLFFLFWECLEVDGCSSVDSFEGQHYSSQWTSRRRGSHWRICVDWKWGVLQCSGYAATVTLQRLGVQPRRSCSSPGGRWLHLDQELCCIFCEERLDPADVVEGKSAGSGHGPLSRITSRNQVRAESAVLSSARVERRIWWLTVSNEEDKLRRMRTDELVETAPSGRSFSER